MHFTYCPAEPHSAAQRQSAPSRYHSSGAVRQGQRAPLPANLRKMKTPPNKSGGADRAEYQAMASSPAWRLAASALSLSVINSTNPACDQFAILPRTENPTTNRHFNALGL